MGPVIGSVLYAFLSYEYSFFVLAGILTIPLITVFFCIPKKVNHAEELPSKSEIDQYFEMLKSS
jgi:hypothetical protein